MTSLGSRAVAVTCGVDLVDVASLARALSAGRGRMVEVCFTDHERRESAGRPDRLATRWAVKEAAAKALGVGLMRGVGFHDVEVVASERGGLALALHGQASRCANEQGLRHWSASVSHERGLAIGFVVAVAAADFQDDEEDSDG